MGGGSVATADADSAGLESSDDRSPRSPDRAGVPKSAVPRRDRPFFEVYKPGQGYYTRMCTAVGGGVLILGAGNFLFNQLEAFVGDATWTKWMQMGVPALVVVGLGLALYWLVGVKRGTCDFLIATEGEMKKVSWSSRNELVGSTKVVIVTTLFMALLLFVVDMLFIEFFRFINVLESAT